MAKIPVTLYWKEQPHVFFLSPQMNYNEENLYAFWLHDTAGELAGVLEMKEGEWTLRKINGFETEDSVLPKLLEALFNYFG